MFGNVIHHWGVRKAAILIVVCSEHQPMDCLVVLKLENQYFFYGEPLVGPTGWHTASSCVCARHIVCIYNHIYIYTHTLPHEFFSRFLPSLLRALTSRLSVKSQCKLGMQYFCNPNKNVKDLDVLHPCQTFFSSLFFQAPQDVSGCEAPTTIATPCHMHPEWYLPPHD